MGLLKPILSQVERMCIREGEESAIRVQGDSLTERERERERPIWQAGVDFPMQQQIFKFHQPEVFLQLSLVGKITEKSRDLAITHVLACRLRGLLDFKTRGFSGLYFGVLSLLFHCFNPVFCCTLDYHNCINLLISTMSSAVVFRSAHSVARRLSLKVSHQAVLPLGTITSVRSVTSQEWREKNNRFRNRLSDLPDWSYTDGRGYGPPSIGQKKRYLGNQELGETVVRRMKELNEAKKFK